MVTVGAAAADGLSGAMANPFGADLRFQAADAAWQGLGEGHGVARSRRAEVQLSGRRVPRPRHAELWLPGPDGTVETVSPPVAARVVPEVVPQSVAAMALGRAG
jgi:hypothetical protein